MNTFTVPDTIVATAAAAADIPGEKGVPTRVQLMVAEAIGTFLLVLFGCGSVHAAVIMGAQMGVWQVAIVWGLAIMLTIFAIGSISGAHINPAITVAMATQRRLAWSLVPLYVIAQLVGAFLAAGVLYFLYGSHITAYEREHQVQRGEPASVVSAMCYGEYFPNPGGLTSAAGPIATARLAEHWNRLSQGVAFLAEVLGTAILAFVVFAVTDPRNSGAPPDRLAPVFIGLTVSALISILGPLTQACFNPARDFGPRLFAYLAGWGSVAIPGPNGIGFVTVYIVAPMVGACLGAVLYVRIVQPANARCA